MNISKISANYATPHFSANNKNTKKPDNQTKVPVLVNISQDKLNNALKAAVLIPAASLPLIMGSCSKEEHCDYWADGNHGTSIKYPSIHVLPELKMDSLVFADDTVRIPKELSADSHVNKTINNFIDTLHMPRLNHGNFPARLAFETPDYIQYMKMDGLASDNETYVYDSQKFNKNGKIDIFKSEIKANGEDLNIKNIGSGINSEYNFRIENDTVTSYKNINGTYVKNAAYSVSDDKKYTIDAVTTKGDTTKITNLNLFCVEPDYED